MTRSSPRFFQSTRASSRLRVSVGFHKLSVNDLGSVLDKASLWPSRCRIRLEPWVTCLVACVPGAGWLAASAEPPQGGHKMPSASRGPPLRKPAWRRDLRRRPLRLARHLRPQPLEPNQLLPLLIPQLEVGAGEALEEGQAGDALHLGGLAVALLQAVVGDLAHQVVDVVVADVAGEPVHDRAEIVEGAAVGPGFVEVPARIFIPVGVFELVLD